MGRYKLIYIKVKRYNFTDVKLDDEYHDFLIVFYDYNEIFVTTFIFRVQDKIKEGKKMNLFKLIS